MGQSGRNCHSSLPFCRLSVEAARHTPVYRELPEFAAPNFTKGSVKPQNSLCHNFLLELKTAKMGNISVMSQFTAGY